MRFLFKSYGKVTKSATAFFLLMFLVSCSASEGPAARTTLVKENELLKENYPLVYIDAVDDALNPEPAEVVSNLMAITKDNPSLVWKEINGEAYVLMSQLVGDTSYYAGYTGKKYNTGNYYVWVTASRELKNLCSQKEFGGDSLTLRLRQLLGLTPGGKEIASVEFWVKPEQLFRPAGFNLPDETEPWYREWFNKLRAKQFYQSNDPSNDAYPWTMLGYTYDWGNPDSDRV